MSVNNFTYNNYEYQLKKILTEKREKKYE